MSEGAYCGGCQCGEVRYTLRGEHYQVYACHCQQCQRQSASAFAMSLPVAAEDFSAQGDLSTYHRPTASGSTTACFFCPRCGVRIYHQSVRSPQLLTLKAGTLDDSAELRPVAHLWTAHKQPWLQLPPEVMTFATQPEDLPAWRLGLLQTI